MFDPSLPQENTVADAAQMRSQFNGLKALIDAISSITAAQVDGVNTLPAGSPAQVNLSVNENTLHFTFDLPRGHDGMNGSNGSDGSQGPPETMAAKAHPETTAHKDRPLPRPSWTA